MRARIFFTLVLLVTTFRLAAQDNPYEIDNNCYTWYQQAELLVGQEGFKEASDQLLKTAQNTNEVNLRGLPQGMYLLRITDEDGATATKKLVVE